MAKHIIRKIQPKWNPLEPITKNNINDYIERTPLNDEKSMYFNPKFDLLKEDFRILTDQSRAYAISAKRETALIEDRTNLVYTDGSCDKNGNAEAKASSGIWFAESPQTTIETELL